MERTVNGHLVVLGRRLEALKGAIERQEMDDIEFVYDQCLRAYTKLGQVLRDGGAYAEASSATVDEMRTAAAETDTFSFQITNMRPGEKELTISAEALDATGDHMKAWVAGRLLHHWRTTGIAPKFAKIDVKVGVE